MRIMAATLTALLLSSVLSASVLAAGGAQRSPASSQAIKINKNTQITKLDKGKGQQKFRPNRKMMQNQAVEVARAEKAEAESNLGRKQTIQDNNNKRAEAQLKVRDQSRSRLRTLRRKPVPSNRRNRIAHENDVAAAEREVNEAEQKFTTLQGYVQRSARETAAAEKLLTEVNATLLRRRTVLSAMNADNWRAVDAAENGVKPLPPPTPPPAPPQRSTTSR